MTDMDSAIAVVCPTCSGRIQIKNRLLLGQIVPCPRCHGLVLLNPDQDQVRVDVDDPVDSQIETREAISSPTVVPPPPLTNHLGSGPPAKLNVSWEPVETRRKRQLLLVATLGGFGLLAASLIFGGFVWSSLGSSAARPQIQALEPIVMPTAEEPSSMLPQIEPSSAEGEPSIPSGNDESTSKDVENAQLISPEHSLPEGTPAHSLTPPNTDSGMSRDLVDPAKQKTPSSATPEIAELPEELRQFVPFLQNDLPDLGPNVSLPAPPTATELQLQLSLPTPRNDALHPPPAETANIAARLDRRLIGFKAKGVSLAELANSFGQLAGVPIWFDQAKLDAVGIDIAKPIDIRVDGKTIGEALGEAAKVAGCQVAEEPTGFVCIRVSDDAIRQSIAPAIAIDDLQVDNRFIDSMLRKLLPTAERSADEEPPPALFQIDETASRITFGPQASIGHQWLAAVCLEAIRLSRDISPRMSESATSRWLHRDVLHQPQTPDDGPVIIESDFSLTLQEWFIRLAKQRHSVTIVQWPATWQHGLTATEDFLPFTRGATFSQFSEQLLQKYDLQIYQDGPEIWWIGPKQAFQERIAVVTVKLDPKLVARGDEVLVAIGKSLQIPNTELPAVIDPTSGHLILRMPRGVANEVTMSLDSLTQ